LDLDHTYAIIRLVDQVRITWLSGGSNWGQCPIVNRVK